MFNETYGLQRAVIEGISIFKVTHWMPIPPLAEEGGEKRWDSCKDYLF